MHQVFRFVLAVLAVWRVTHLIASEDGPWDMFRALRTRAGDSFAGRLMSCFYCLSVWTAAPAAWFVGGTAVEMVFAWLAASGAAILLERATAPPLAFSLEGSDDELLRRDEGTSHDQPG